MEGLDHTNRYWVRVFSFPSLCLVDFNLSVCVSIFTAHLMQLLKSAGY